MNSLFLSDGYKYGHHQQYPEGTTLVYSNFTPRSNKYAPKGCDEVVVFGTQLAIIYLHEHFAKNFFYTLERIQYANDPSMLALIKTRALREVKKELDMYLNTDYDMKHFEELYDLGYLPIKVKALEEGTLCPIKIPMMTIRNTRPEFFWITNFLESILSNLLWKPVTSASIAIAYKRVLLKYAKETDEKNLGFVDWQAHDFSFRGMDSEHAVVASGLGHLTSFCGTDSLPALWGARNYYHETGFIAGSVPATEHSVMCAGGKESEIDTFRRLLKVYPTGIVSVVSDTWDLWNVCTVLLPQMKEEILARDGKLVIRPDSGDPVDIICGLNSIKNLGDPRQINGSPEGKGVIELLWDVFGGTTNGQGFKVLDPHIGAIYGDSITIDRATEICERLKAKGFASTNIVLGVGSFTYQYNTRDTFGFAMKATYVERSKICADCKGEGVHDSGICNNCLGQCTETIGYPIFKDPITDDGTKKSATGLLRVIKEKGTLSLQDNVTWEEENTGMLKLLYEDGIFYSLETLTGIRERINKSL